MIDHLIEGGFTRPAEVPADAPCWTDAGRAILPVKVWREEGAFLDGEWFLVRCEALDPELQAMPGYRWAWSDDADDFAHVASDDDLELSGWWA